MNEWDAAAALGEVAVSVRESEVPAGETAIVDISVSDAWPSATKGARLEIAQYLQRIWAQLHPEKESDSCRIRLLDGTGRRVGGSRMWGGSLIWVED